MKFVVFGSSRQLGILLDNRVLDLGALAAQRGRMTDRSHHTLPVDLRALVEGGEPSVRSVQQAVSLVARNLAAKPQHEAEKLFCDYAKARLHPPIPTPSAKIICAGANFASHASRARGISMEEATRSAKARPFGFTKTARLFVGDGGRVQVPSRSKELDYEIELAVVIGRRGRDIPREKAMDYVFGYTGLIDYSLRDQDDSGPFSIPFAKNFDGCGALGPTLVTKDEVPDSRSVRLELRVNDQTRQQGSTEEMIQGFDEMIAWYSRDMTLFPGDILSGGTCSGTAMEKRNMAKDWSWFLKPGDTVEGWVEGVGKITNRIVAKGEGESFE